jgi:hypothetical protein
MPAWTSKQTSPPPTLTVFYRWLRRINCRIEPYSQANCFVGIAASGQHGTVDSTRVEVGWQGADVTGLAPLARYVVWVRVRVRVRVRVSVKTCSVSAVSAVYAVHVA